VKSCALFARSLHRRIARLSLSLLTLSRSFLYLSVQLRNLSHSFSDGITPPIPAAALLVYMSICF